MASKGCVIFVILIVFCIGAHSLRNNNNKLRPGKVPEPKQYDGHLPNTTYPVHYHLHLSTNVHRQGSRYRGNNTIELQVLEDTTEIALHAVQLTITHIEIRNLVTNEMNRCVSYELDSRHQLLRIKCATNCAQTCAFKRYQRLSLTILFEANIGDTSMGFNKMKLADGGHAMTAFGAYTFMEPINARSVFPCYDEPQLRANFSIRVTHGKSYVANSNMPAIRRVSIKRTDLVTTYFATTPLMSTYLVSFIISAPYHSVQQSYNGIRHRMLVPASSNFNREALLQSLNNSIALVELMGAYWQQPYPLPKLDHCAVPGLIAAAMENWGLITYHPDYLSISNNQLALIVQAHEIVHQWFGNLVTIRWWSHLWLSEAFATYYSYIFTDKLHAEAQVMHEFDATCYDSFSLSVDHAVVSHVDTPQKQPSDFSLLMYDRAPCILQMFAYEFGEEVFRKALTRYLALYKYANADTAALADVLQHEVEQDYMKRNQIWPYEVTEIMESWLEQKDYPIVYVRRNYMTNELHITQQSFGALSANLWWLPLEIVAGANCAVKVYMAGTAKKVVQLSKELNCTAANWYLINPYGKAYYPVVYDKENWLRLAKALQHNPHSFEPGMRIAIIRNFCFVRKLQLPDHMQIRMEFNNYISKERNQIVVDALSYLPDCI